MGDEGTVTVRIIKSFEYKNYRSLIFHGVALQMATLEDVARLVRERIEEKAALAQYRACTFDTFKMYYQPFGAKTSNPMINLGNDEALILADEQAPLAALGIQDGSEISYFKRADYEAYRADPQPCKWE